ncbi:MAG: homocysteine S-methyltransferase family protein [SAR202 cluster bacterium]|nr:homocysteine S-methyltransferase family protein [SAR202 cluster bacterium]
MSRPDLVTRLAAGAMVLDGAISTELKRRGVIDSRESDGTVRKGIASRSATAVLDAPAELQSLHEDYLRAGADIITTNTFNTNRAKFDFRGIPEMAGRLEEINVRAVEIAVRARDSVKPGAYVAGSISPPKPRGAPIAPERAARDYIEQARILAGAGVDALLLEYHSSVAECVLAVRSVSGLGVPVLLGVCNVTEGGLMASGESFGRLAESLAGTGVSAVLAMCSRPDAISAALPKLIEEFDVAFGAYPNVVGDSEFTPEVHAAYAEKWRAMGARVVGGCCGTTPAHVAAVAQCL